MTKLANGTEPGNERSPIFDAGADRDTRPPKPCARRFAPGRWCTRTDQHPPEECGGPPAREFPPEELERGRVH